MNFKIERFCTLAISFLLGVFFFLIGLFSIILPWSSFLQQAATDLIVNHTLILSLFGIGLALMGISIAVYAILNISRRYAYIKIGERSVSLDETLIKQYLQDYWTKKLPNVQVPFYLSIRKNSIQIVADLPPMAEEVQDSFLEKIQNDFSDLFDKRLGYPNEVHLVAHFQTEPPSGTEKE